MLRDEVRDEHSRNLLDIQLFTDYELLVRGSVPFKRIIIEGYLTNHVKDLVLSLNISETKDAKVLEQLKSVVHFKTYLDALEDNSNSAKENILAISNFNKDTP